MQRAAAAAEQRPHLLADAGQTEGGPAVNSEVGQPFEGAQESFTRQILRVLFIPHHPPAKT